MKRIFSYAKPFALALCGVFFLKFLAAFIELQIPTMLADVIDVGVPKAKETGTSSILYVYGARMLAMAICAAVVNYSANVWSSWITTQMLRRIRQDLFVKVSYLSTRQMNELTVPSAVSRLTSDTYNVNSMFLRGFRIGVRAPMLLICGLIMTFRLDAQLALILLAALPPVVLVTAWLTKKSVPLFRTQQTMLDGMIRTVRENVTGIRVIKALSKTDYEKTRFDGVNAELADQKVRAGTITALSRPTSNLILNFCLVLIVLFGAMRVSSGLLLPGRIIAFTHYFTMILNATIGIAGLFTILSHGVASAQRIDAVMSLEPELPILNLPAEPSDYAVEFRHVSFSYHKGAEKNLDDVSFKLKKGQTLGIIGGTGSGKTMLLRLLVRFYDADEGQILISGRDVRSIPNEELRTLFGVTLQNDFLSATTIRENIAYFRDLDEDALRRAAQIAQATDFINEKEGGLDAPLTKSGNNLSGGQKQRLLIARAVAADPDILILDDASSALDYRTDAALRKALSESCRDAVKFIIAQRISSIRHADCILMLDGGKVIGQGTHDELMASCAAYREIAEAQMELVGEGVASLG